MHTAFRRSHRTDLEHQVPPSIYWVSLGKFEVRLPLTSLKWMEQSEATHICTVLLNQMTFDDYVCCVINRNIWEGGRHVRDLDRVFAAVGGTAGKRDPSHKEPAPAAEGRESSCEPARDEADCRKGKAHCLLDSGQFSSECLWQTLCIRSRDTGQSRVCERQKEERLPQHDKVSD